MVWRVFLVLLLAVVVVLCLALSVVGTLLQRSMLIWPAPAPVQVTGQQPRYPAGGWEVALPFGWVRDPANPNRWIMHEGVLLVGPVFCAGCPVPPLADLDVVWVQWDRSEADDPLRAGFGVTVEAHVQHPEESGSLAGAPLAVRYGRLQPYRVFVRVEVCQEAVTCPVYEATDAAAVTVACPGRLVTTYSGIGEWHYAYATPGTCTAEVAWPAAWTPDGPVRVTFDQRIVPGERASDAVILFRARMPPPPTPTPTPPPTLPDPTVGGGPLEPTAPALVPGGTPTPPAGGAP